MSSLLACSSTDTRDATQLDIQPPSAEEVTALLNLKNSGENVDVSVYPEDNILCLLYTSDAADE